MQGDRWQACSFKWLEEPWKKRIILTQPGMIQKRTHTQLLWLYPSIIKKEEFYSSAPGYSPHCSRPAGLLSPAEQRDAWEPALGLQVTTETIFLFHSAILFCCCYNFGWIGKLVMSTSFFKVVFYIKITVCPNLLTCQQNRLLIYQKYIKGVLLVVLFKANNKRTTLFAIVSSYIS